MGITTSSPTWKRMYHGEMTAGEADRWLLLQRDSPRGMFLVRNSRSCPRNYTISVRDINNVHHYLIQRSDNDRMVFIGQNLRFKSMLDLVEYYRHQENGLSVKLGVPCPKIQPSDTRLVVDWEVRRADVKVGVVIGQGQFAKVHEGVLLNHIRVAVKELKTGSMDPKEFLREASILMKLKHKRLVHLHGVCSDREPIFIITELAAQGSLLNFLKNQGSCLNLHKLIELGEQVAEGMAYLEQHYFLHRDLAARNVLVNEYNDIKIADFGLSKFIKHSDAYVGGRSTRFALKWTAPEAAVSRTFTVKSDVWSFGVLLWEIITLGKEPYPGLSSKEALQRVSRGYVMPAPAECAQAPSLYAVVKQCWQRDPHKRPDFIQLQKLLNTEKRAWTTSD